MRFKLNSVFCFWSFVFVIGNFLFTNLSAQNFVPFQEVKNIPPGKAVIYIYRPNPNVKGDYYVIINDKLASYFPLYCGGCMIYYADPGVVIINTDEQNAGNLVTQVKEGEKVFIQGIYKKGETSFRRIEEAKGLHGIKSCKLYERQFVIGKDKIKSIALISTTISKPELPVAIKSDFNDNISSKMGNILGYENFKIAEIREMTVKKLREYFEGDIFYGEMFNTITGIQDLRSKYPQVTFTNDPKQIPALIPAPADINPFVDYHNNVDDFFDNSENYLTPLSDIGEVLKTDYLAICITRLVMRSANDYGSCGTIRLVTDFFLFRKDGSLMIKDQETRSTNEIVKGNDPDSYKKVLDLFPYTLVPVLERITHKLSKKFKD